MYVPLCFLERQEKNTCESAHVIMCMLTLNAPSSAYFGFSDLVFFYSSKIEAAFIFFFFSFVAYSIDYVSGIGIGTRNAKRS